jgi:hypothetical protein
VTIQLLSCGRNVRKSFANNGKLPYHNVLQILIGNKIRYCLASCSVSNTLAGLPNMQ